MFSSCLYVDTDAGFGFLNPHHDSAFTCDRVVHCIECGCDLPPGTVHHLFEGTRPSHVTSPGVVEQFHTCVGCQRIWDGLAGGEQVFSTLDELVWDAYGIPLNGVPEAEVEIEWDELAQEHGDTDVDLRKAISAKPPLEQVFIALRILEDFVSLGQLHTIFEWATSARSDPADDKSIQERLEDLDVRERRISDIKKRCARVYRSQLLEVVDAMKRNRWAEMWFRFGCAYRAAWQTNPSPEDERWDALENFARYLLRRQVFRNLSTPSSESSLATSCICHEGLRPISEWLMREGQSGRVEERPEPSEPKAP